MTTREIADKARELANALFQRECNQTERCLEAEEQRPLGRKERKLGWERRPFDAYLPHLMCASCRAYWHQEMAAQVLHRTACLEERAAALAQREREDAE